MSQISMLQNLNSTLKENLEQKERHCESLRKEIEKERKRSSQLEMLLRGSHQLQVILLILKLYIIFLCIKYNLQASKQEKETAEEDKKDYIPGMVSK